MLFKIYNMEHEFVGIVDNIRNCSIETSLETGVKTLSFQLPLNEANLQLAIEEYYLENWDYEYVIKEVNFKDNSFINVYCRPNLESLTAIVPVFDAFDINVEAALKKALKNSPDWSLEYHSNTKTAVSYQLAKMSVKEILEQIKEDYQLEFLYDTKAKILKVYDYMGADRGVYFSNELKLKLLKRQGQSYDIATILYPIGKDGLTIASVNNGREFLENYDYCSKHIPLYWIQDDIEYADQLKMMGEQYLRQVAAPVISYGIELSSLPENLQIGDKITIVDNIKKIKQKQRVVKIINYPLTPEKDRVELSNQLVNFADTFVKFTSAYDKQIKYIKNNLSTLD